MSKFDKQESLESSQESWNQANKRFGITSTKICSPLESSLPPLLQSHSRYGVFQTCQTTLPITIMTVIQSIVYIILFLHFIIILTALLEIHDCSIRIYTYLIMIITASLIRSCKATPPELLLACSVFSGDYAQKYLLIILYYVILCFLLLTKIPTH